MKSIIIVLAMLALSGCTTAKLVGKALYAASPATANSQPMFVCGSFVDPELGKLLAQPCARARF